MTRRLVRSILLALAVVIVLVVAFLIYANVAVGRAASGRLYGEVGLVPHTKVALLLGTNPLNRLGGPNSYFVNRVHTAARLYHAGKADYILASGDNHIRAYDEPQAMRDSLVALGVPADRIILDYAGFRTLDSVVRAKEVFGCNTLTIVSQADHCERALFIAEANGVVAEAVAAPLRAGRWVRVRLALREWLARGKMMLDLWLGKQPHFLGEKIDIPDLPFQKSYSSADGITMRILNLDSLTAPVDSLSLEFVNDTDSDMTFGEMFEIQHYKDGAWTEVPYDMSRANDDGELMVIFPAVAYVLSPRSSCAHPTSTWHYGNNLVAGKYRLVKDINRKDSAYVEFQIVPR